MADPGVRAGVRAGVLSFALLAVPGLAMEAGGGTPGPTAPGEAAFVDALLARMTLAEKLGQLSQGRDGAAATGPAVAGGNGAAVRAGRIGSLLGVHGAARTRALQRIAVEGSRLGIPLLFAYDVIHGFRTIFPVPLAEAASWDLERIEGAARIAATEATAQGVHWTYAPMVDIARDPRWGRVVEGAGESPHLGARVAAARVRGFQGDDLAAPDTLLATAKHFVAYGAAEGGRDYDVADISARTLLETYVPPFAAAVEAGAASVMTAFNEVEGVPMHANAPLVDGLLRGELGFDGVVVSDYEAVRELIVHGVAADERAAGELALRAGVDVDMLSDIYTGALPAAVRAGEVPIERVDAAVRRVLLAKYRLGLFHDPYRYADPARERALTLAPAHRRAARALAAESIVLLKNAAGLLPLDVGDVNGVSGDDGDSDDEGTDTGGIDTLAVIGPLADDRGAVLGGWSMLGRAAEAVSVLDGLRAALPPGTRVLHAPGAAVRGDDTSGFAAAVAAARRADAVVLVLGESRDMSSEANNRVSLDLPGVQDALAAAIVATGKPIVAVLVNGRPLSVQRLDDTVGAILETWYLGSEAGNAVADVLLGRVVPSGKLPLTFPRSVGQVPIHHDARRTGRPHVAGGHYVTRYIDSPSTPLYPFGHGLSYTTFAYADIALDAATLDATGTLEVSARVTNTGARRGTEIVQLYTHDPVASVTRPLRELKGFRRVTLAPGESARVAFTLSAADLAFRDARLRPVAEAGDIDVHVAPSSVGGLVARFTLVEDWRPDASGGGRPAR